MEGYLGEFDVDIASSPYADYTSADWALYWIGSYGQIDGSHHKLWVLDQIARILNGTEVQIREARWSNGHSEYRITLKEPVQQYHEWVEMMRGDYDEEYEEYEYSYNTGTAP